MRHQLSNLPHGLDLILYLVLVTISYSTLNASDYPRIVYVAGTVADRKICTYQNNSDFCLTDSSFANSFNPVWSPNGNFIAFGSNSNLYSQIYLIDTTGNAIRQISNLTFENGIPLRPLWLSNDVIGFITLDSSGQTEVHRINIFTNEHSTFSNNIQFGLMSTLSPSNSIILNGYNGEANNLYILNDVNELTSLTNGNYINTVILTAPDSSHRIIVLRTLPDFQNYEIALINFGVEITETVIDDALQFSTLAWSPDGNYIAYTSQTDSTNRTSIEIKVFDLHNGIHQTVINTSQSTIIESWGTDPNHLIVSVMQERSWHLAVLDLDDHKLEILAECGQAPCEANVIDALE